MSIDNGLWKSAEVIRTGGFVKNGLGEPGDLTVAHCALGAYREAYGEKNIRGNGSVAAWADREHADEIAVLVDVIHELFPLRAAGSTPAHRVMNFNDHALTTEEDVVKVFRVAAVKFATGI